MDPKDEIKKIDETTEIKVVDKKEIEKEKTIVEKAQELIDKHNKVIDEINEKPEIDPTIELNKTIENQITKLKEQENLISKLSSIITNGNQSGEKQETKQEIKDYAKAYADALAKE